MSITQSEQPTRIHWRTWLAWLVLIGVAAFCFGHFDGYQDGRLKGYSAAMTKVTSDSTHWSDHSGNNVWVMVTSEKTDQTMARVPALVPVHDAGILASKILSDDQTSSVLITRGADERTLRMAYEPVDHLNPTIWRFNDYQARRELGR